MFWLRNKKIKFSLRTLNLRPGGSYMSALVLLNLLNQLGKRDKMRGLPSVLSLFHSCWVIRNRGSYMIAHVLIEFIKQVAVFCQGRALAPLALKKSIWRREIPIDGPLGASVFPRGRIVYLSIK